MINITEQDKDVQEWFYDTQDHDYLLALLSTSTFEGRAREVLEMEINNIQEMTVEDFQKIASQLQNNQLDRITSGLNYSVTDISKHLKKFM